jgi:hypothetical protein
MILSNFLSKKCNVVTQSSQITCIPPTIISEGPIKWLKTELELRKL